MKDSTPSTSAPKMSSQSVEVVFAQKLASNDPKIRNKAVKKLNTWLSIKAKSGVGFDEDEMLRIWKGLHYCFWMSDKPLVQEELAESISKLIQTFQGYPKSANLFIRSSLVTLGREWFGIDRLRMDKFMMLVRRLLRQIFIYCARNEWKNSQDIINIFTETVMRVNKTPKDLNTALGLQLHFTDVYLEELAKIGGEDLPDPVVRDFLKPFILEFRDGFDERLREQITERIFHHLMRQSDIGIAYEEDDGASEVEDLDNPDLDEDSEDEEEEGGNEDTNMNGDAKDPRAGRVDVVIPQLLVDFELLAKDLFEAGNDSKVTSTARSRLFNLTKQFKALAGGKYPLALDLPDEDTEQIKMSHTEMVEKRMKEELREQAKREKERLEYQKVLKKNRKRTHEEPETNGDESVVEEEMMPAKKKKKKAKKAADAKTNGVANHDEDSKKTTPTEPPLKKKKKAKKHNDQVSPVINGDAKKADQNGVEKKLKLTDKKKAKKLRDEEELPKTGLPGGAPPTIQASTPTHVTPTFLRKALSKTAKAKDNKKTPSPMSKGSQSEPQGQKKKRRINFSLTSNQYQSLLDHSNSITESPGIPFAPDKKPKQGVLRIKKDISVVDTPSPLLIDKIGVKTVLKNTKINGKSKTFKRMMASDFF